MSVSAYEQTPELLVAPESQWEAAFASQLETYGLKWTLLNCKTKAQVLAEDDGISKSREKRNKVAEGGITKGGKSDDPEYVHFEYIGEHKNHSPGDLDDRQHLPLSKKTRAIIEERLQEGYSKRHTRIAIQNNYNKYIMDQVLFDGAGIPSSVVHRD